MVVKEISERLVKKKHKVTVYAVDLEKGLPKRQFVNGVLVKRYRSILGDPLYLPSVKFFVDLRNENAEVIHIHNVHILLTLFAILFKNKHQKLVLQPHYHRFGQTKIRHLFFIFHKHLINYIALPRVNLIVVNSPYEEGAVKEDFSQCKRITFIQEAVNVNELNLVKWTPKRPWRILYVGALKKYKNVDKLLRAFALLLNQEKTPLTLVIVGDGPERNRLIKLAQQLGIERYVTWKHGLSRQQLLYEYSQARVFVFLSSLESFSRVVHEALIIGVPIVTLNAGATAKLVQEGLAEGVCSFEPEKITQAIIKVLKKRTTKTKVAMTYFTDWEEYLRQLMAVYHSVRSEDH